MIDGTRHMHPALWRALRRVERGEAPGSPEDRDCLIVRGLIEWTPGESSLRLTGKGRSAVRDANREGR